MTEQHAYTHPDHQQFVQDMEAAGLQPEHYRGRFDWEGPACRVDHPQDALSVTQVRCQWDTTGLGWVVYPAAYAES